MNALSNQISFCLSRLEFRKMIMLTSTFRALVNNSVKENFYGKRKKTINIL